MGINLLYCFDKNYDKQAFVSINSILRNIDFPVSIFIIHETPETFNGFQNQISLKDNVEKIIVYQFKKNNYDFPNLKDKHISKATYFRMFIKEYLPGNLEKVLYIDPDIVCLNEASAAITHEFQKLLSSEFTIAAKETGTIKDSFEMFAKLGLKGTGYFNAGVMFINYKKWQKGQITEELIKTMNKNYDNIVFWDQDVLNLYFDGNFQKISKSLNFNFTSKFNDKNYIDSVKETTIFLHYSGKVKPWYLIGIFQEYSSFYHDMFREVFKEKYHIERYSSKRRYLFELIHLIYKLKFLSLKFPISFLIISTKKLFSFK
jgi:lipopolysaccharide biosynthesis glycosyltransferase